MRITKDRLRTLIREELTRTLSEDAHRAVTMSSTDPYEYIKIDDVWHTRKKGDQGDWVSLAGNEEAIARLEGEGGSSPRASQNALRRIRRAVLDRVPGIVDSHGGDLAATFGRATPIRIGLVIDDTGAVSLDDSVTRIYPESTSASEDYFSPRLSEYVEQHLDARGENALQFTNSQGERLMGDDAAEALRAEVAANQPIFIEYGVSYIDRPEELLAMRGRDPLEGTPLEGEAPGPSHSRSPLTGEFEPNR